MLHKMIIFKKGVSRFSFSNMDHFVVDVLNLGIINHFLVFGYNNSSGYQVNYIKLDEPKNIDEIVNPNPLELFSSNGKLLKILTGFLTISSINNIESELIVISYDNNLIFRVYNSLLLVNEYNIDINLSVNDIKDFKLTTDYEICMLSTSSFTFINFNDKNNIIVKTFQHSYSITDLVWDVYHIIFVV